MFRAQSGDCGLRAFALALAIFCSATWGAGQLPAQEPPAREGNAKSSRVATVQRIGEDGEIVLRLGEKEQVVTLIGVAWPEDETAVALRDYLDRLLLGESIIVDEAAVPQTTTKPSESGKLRETADAPRAVFLRRAPDHYFVNLEIVRLGYARVLAKPTFAQLAEFREAESKARDAGKGVWAIGGDGRGHETGQRVERGKGGREVKPDGEKPRSAGGKSSAENAGDTVYVTPSGKKYHRSDCRFAANAKSISLDDAVRKGYAACSRCKPPAR